MRQTRIILALAVSCVLGLGSAQAAPSLTPPQTLGASGALAGFGGASGTHQFFLQTGSTWKGDIAGITSGVSYSFVVQNINASSVVGPDGRYLYFNLQDSETGSTFKHLGINVYPEPFSGAGGGTLFQSYQNFTSEGLSSHGLSAGVLTVSDFDLRFDFTKASPGSGSLVTPYYRLAAGSWTAFSGGSFTGSAAFDFLGAKFVVGFDGGADGSLTFGNAYLASPTDTCWVDDDWSALADGTPVVFPGNPKKHTIGVDAFGTCQAGVDNVSGSSVLLAAGTYEEQVEIDGNLELMGSGMGVSTILAPTSLPLFFTTSPNNNYPVVYVHDAATVVMHDFTVDGAGRGNANYRFIGVAYRNAGGSVTDVEIKDIRNNPINGAQHGVGLYAYADNGTARTLDITACDIHGFQKNGMALLGADLTATADGNSVTGAGAVSFIAQNGIQLSLAASGSLTGNNVSGFAYTPATFASAGLLIYSAAGSVLASGNSVNESQVGIWYIDAEGTISENSLTNTPGGMGATPYWWQIVADPGEGVKRQPPAQLYDSELPQSRQTATANAATLTTLIERNTVAGGGNGTGIEGDAYGTEVLNFTATENFVSGCAAGFDMYNDPTATVNTIIFNNSATGNTLAVANNSTALQNASGNWWGNATPGGVGVLMDDSVDYTPWLAVGTDTDLGTPGFQGDFGTLWVDDDSPQLGAILRVQEGVNLVTASLVIMAPGIYEEQVEIDQNVELMGSGMGVSTILAPTSLPLFFTTSPNNNYPVVYVHDAATVVMHDFTVDGAGRGNANYRFIGVAYRNAGGSVTDVEIKDIRNNPIDGAQHGVGLYAYADNGTARTLDITACDIHGFQKNGMALLGADLTATADGNSVTGAGAVSFIAQNGIQLSLAASGSLTGNNVSGFAYTPATFASAGLLIYSAAGSVLASGNSVNESQVGIWYIDAEGTISENSLTNTPGGMGATPYWWQIVADPGEGVKRQPPAQLYDSELPQSRQTATANAATLTTLIERNTVAGGGNGTGIEGDAYGTEVLNFTATENFVSGCAAGFDMYNDPTATVNTIIFNNSATGNTLAVANNSTALQNASGNWWGNATPGGVGVLMDDSVDYTPWLAVGTDTDLGTPGFQGDFGTLWVDDDSPQLGAILRVQEGVNLVTASLVIMAPGIYEEQVEIDQNVELMGSGMGVSTILAPTSLPLFFTTSPNNNYPVVYVHDAATVVMHDFTVDGAGRGNANYRFIGVAYRNAGGSVTDVEIKDIRNNPIDGAQHGVGLYAYADNGTARTLDITACDIHGFQKNGMALLGADLTATADGNSVTGAGAVSFIAQNGIQLSLAAQGSLTGNNVSGFAYTPATFASAGLLIYSAAGPVVTTGNTVNESQVGIWYIDADGDISGNTVTNTALGMGATPFWWGIVADPGVGAMRQPPASALDADMVAAAARWQQGMRAYAAALITTAFGNTLNGGGNGTGLEADALGTETLTFTAHNNDITNWAVGVVLYKDAGATLAAQVRYNLIHGNAYGMDNQSGVLQDGIKNWWGHPTGPSHSANPHGLAAAGDSCSNLVSYLPWYATATTTTLSERVSVFNVGINTALSDIIQGGVDAAVPGDSVTTIAAIFEEQVSIAKSLSLTGAGANLTTIKSPPALTASFVTSPNTNYPIVYVHDAAAVTLRTLGVDGAGRGNANYRFMGMGFRNAGGFVDRCDVKGIRNNPIDGAQHGVGIYAYADNGTARTLLMQSCNVLGFQKNGMALLGDDLTATVVSCRVTGAGAVSFIAQNGVQLGLGAQGSITGSIVEKFSYTPATYASAGILVYQAAGSVTIEDNDVLESQVGIWYIEAEGDIQLNRVSNTMAGMGATPYWWGIVADPGVSTLRQPPFHLFDGDLALARVNERTAEAAALTTMIYRNVVNGGGNGTGIEADALGTETLNFTATENAVTACAAGFDLYKDPTATLNAVVNTNGISGNMFGLLNSSGVLQDGMANWWGNATGPKVASNSGSTGDSVAADVDYSPWLGKADASPGTPGYQAPLPMHWWVNTSHASTIQEAVVFSATGDTVTAKPGSYHDHIVIPHRLVIQGQTPGTAVVYPATSNVGPAGPPSFTASQIVVVEADDVTLRNLVFDGDSPTLTPPGTLDARNAIITNYNSGDWDRLTVTGCTVRNIYLRGIYASAASTTSGHVFRDNTVDNVDGWSLQSAGIMFFAATGEAVKNDVSNSSLGIFFQAGSEGRADSNDVTSCEVGIGANNNDAATTIKYNTIQQCGNGGGIQLVIPMIATDVGHNTLSACTSGVVVYGGNLSFTQNIHDNRITGTGPLVEQGVYASTDVSPWGFHPVSAQLSRNVITNNRFGIVLNELNGNPAPVMDVTIGGSSSNTDSLYNNGLLELFLEDCNDSIDARFNYWGETECDSIESRIYHQPDLASLGLVDYGDALCGSCPIVVSGDFNFDGLITSGDIIFLVNYIFKGGPDPLPIEEAGDVNCDGVNTSADIIYMVNWVFKGGPAACDICSIL